MPGQENPQEEGMATHSTLLAWESRGQRRLAATAPGVQPDPTEQLNSLTQSLAN